MSYYVDRINGVWCVFRAEDGQRMFSAIDEHVARATAACLNEYRGVHP